MICRQACCIAHNYKSCSLDTTARIHSLWGVAQASNNMHHTRPLQRPDRGVLLLSNDMDSEAMLAVQLDIIRETEVNISSAMTDQSDSLAAEKKNHKRSSDLLAKVQKKLAAQPGVLWPALAWQRPLRGLCHLGSCLS